MEILLLALVLFFLSKNISVFQVLINSVWVIFFFTVSLGHWFSTGSDFTLRRNLAMSRATFDCHATSIYAVVVWKNTHKLKEK